MSTFTATLTLVLIMDPLGNLPVFASVLKDVDPARRGRVVRREMLFALGILVATLLVGGAVLEVLGLTNQGLEIGGGALLLLIALKMVFPSAGGLSGDTPDGEPFLVPLAVPFVAGPSTVSVLLLLSNTEPGRLGDWFLALLGAWSVTFAVLAGSGPLLKRLGPRGLAAMERLMGIVLFLLAIQMPVNGVQGLLEGP